MAQFFAAMEASCADECARVNVDRRYTEEEKKLITVEMRSAIHNAEQAIQNVYWEEDGVLPSQKPK